jgi:hypothetical protein
MMLVYGTWLTKLPFIDERSPIMQPVIGLQDYFVSKWQENLPDDDIEKYLDWYIFRLRTYIEPNAGGIILYGSKRYTFDEVIEFNEQSWKTIEAITQYSAKDKLFNEVRYAAFNNLSALFVSNFTAYWAHNPFKGDFSNKFNANQFEKRYLTTNSYVDSEAMSDDCLKHKRLLKLYKWIKKMDNLYALEYPEIYSKSKSAEAADYWINSRLHGLVYMIIDHLIETKKYQIRNNFCDVDKNPLLADYISSKKWLVENKEFLQSKHISNAKIVTDKRDKRIELVCPNLNIKRELNNGNNNNR